MATIGNSNSQNEEKKTLTSGAGPAYMGTSSSKQGNQQSGQFTGLRNFLAANKQAGQQLAGQITGQGEKLREGAQSGIKQLEDTSKSATDLSKTITQAGESTEAIIKAPSQTPAPAVAPTPAPVQQKPRSSNIWGNTNWSQGFETTPTASPAPVIPGAEQLVVAGSKEAGGAKTALQGATSATKDLTLSADKAGQEAAKSTIKYVEHGKQLQTEQGRSNLLQNLLNPKGTYTGGKSVLDQAFLQRGGQQQLQQAIQQSKALSPELQAKAQQAQQGAQASIAALGTTAEDVRNRVLGTISSTGEAIKKDAATSAATKTKQAQDDYNIMSSYLGGADPATMSTPEQGRLNQLLGEQGLNRGMQTFGVKASDFLTPGQLNVTSEQAMTQQQIAQLNALNELSGSGDRVSQQAISAAMSLSPEMKKQISDKASAYMTNFQPVQEAKMSSEKKLSDLSTFKNQYERSDKFYPDKYLVERYAEDYQYKAQTPRDYENLAQFAETRGDKAEAAAIREQGRYKFVGSDIQATQTKIAEQNAKIAELNKTFNVDQRLK